MGTGGGGGKGQGGGKEANAAPALAAHKLHHRARLRSDRGTQVGLGLLYVGGAGYYDKSSFYNAPRVNRTKVPRPV